MNHGIENWLYEKLGGEWCGNVCPPGDMETLRWVEQGKECVASVWNDGFELMVGSPSRWEWSIRREYAPRLAWFILWHWWIRWEWFGLRRFLWYWLLHRKCERSNRLGKMFRERESASLNEK
jgi:hypothetical protein